MNRFNEALGYDLDAEDVEYTINEVNEFAEKISKLAWSERKLLFLIFNNCKVEKVGSEKKLYVPVKDVFELSHENEIETKRILKVLESNSLCIVDEIEFDVDETEFNSGAIVYKECVILIGLRDYEEWWIELKKYCDIKNISAEEILVELKFDQLD